MDDQKNIVIIEDEIVVQKTLDDHLTRKGYHVFAYSAAEDAVNSGNLGTCNAVIMDIGLPGISGLEATQYVKTNYPEIPVIMLTAFSDVNDRISGFETGADDYIIKPFFIEELIARLKSVLRRYEMVPGVQKRYQIGDLTINMKGKSVTRNDVPVRLSITEYNLLVLLAENEGNPVSKEEILKKIWKGRYAVSENTVEVYINLLRNKIDKQYKKKLIQTKPGYGYFISTD
jgi:two-component system, OmpR family, copper resistance phosphate regulon response regulator CusR